jgi:hypothetical protein
MIYEPRNTLYKPLCLPWYRHKARPSFADMLATLRLACLDASISSSPFHGRGRQNPPVPLLDTLMTAA